MLLIFYLFALNPKNNYNYSENYLKFMYDLIVIGSGPAGLTAGIYAARRELNVLVVGKELGGQLVWANEIENYPGFRKIKSSELIDRIHQQALDFGVDVKIDEVQKITKTSAGNFTIHTARGIYEAKVVIISMGLSPRRLALPGEIEFNGRGVSYCANCDGPLFRDKTVAVIGGGNSALDAAEMLSKIAEKVYLIHRGAEFRGFESLVREIKSRGNIGVLLNTEIKSILGSGRVERLEIFNTSDKKGRELSVHGVFIEIGRIASTDLVAELVDRDNRNQIIAAVTGATRTPGLFAAGDVTVGEFKQLTIAMGQATAAALSAYKYLREQSGLPFIAKNY